MVSTNPEWYQELCAQHAVSRRNKKRALRRRHDTSVRREHTLRALRRIASNKPQRSNSGLVRPPAYVAMLLPVVRAEIRKEKSRRADDRKPITIEPVPQREREDWEPW